MTRLLALYPDAWRARYGDEVEALLASRPPNLHDRLDIVRGAIDARLNPQRPGSPKVLPDTVDRAIGALVIGAGALFTIWAAVILVYATPWDAASSEVRLRLGVAWSSGFLGSLLGAVAVLAIVLRHGGRIGELGVLGGLALSLGLLLTAAGPLAGLLIGYGTVLLARGIGGRIVSTAGATLFVAATFLAIAGLLAANLSAGQELRALWLFLPFGPAWVALGFGLIRHREAPVAGLLA